MTRSLGHLSHVVKSFLKQKWDCQHPLLLAYSGGPDSKALLYATLDFGKAPLHIAHVDHGWREESCEEAAVLQREAEKLQIPFHSIRLLKKTTEEEAREMRLAFFRSLKEKFQFQAVLMGHQADDLSETVLKRVFEGAHLHHLGAMRPVSLMEGLTIWRPLLGISRKEIENFLKERNHTPLRDPSNEVLSYQRVRMRRLLIPYLQDLFGKGIVRNIVTLSQRSLTLSDYWEHRFQRSQDQFVVGPYGIYLDANSLHPLEIESFISRILQNENQPISRELLQAIVTSLCQKKCKKMTPLIYADRGIFFLLKTPLPQFGGPVSLTVGSHRSGDWNIEVEKVATSLPLTGWKRFWQGHYQEQVFFSPATLQMVTQKNSKTPSFLRSCIPTIISNNKRVDFNGNNNSGEFIVKIYTTIK